MSGKAFDRFVSEVKKICMTDKRYRPEAYIFLREAISHIISTKGGKGNEHISGKELVEGIRKYALQTFGPMASTVFTCWGINKTEDFGNIVYNLVEVGILKVSEEDSIDDFKNCYDFYEAFVKPYLPKHGKKTVRVCNRRKRVRGLISK